MSVVREPDVSVSASRELYHKEKNNNRWDEIHIGHRWAKSKSIITLDSPANSQVERSGRGWVLPSESRPLDERVGPKGLSIFQQEGVVMRGKELKVSEPVPDVSGITRVESRPA